MTVLLDALTLFLLLSFALSVVTGGLAWALRPGAALASEARRLLMLPPVGALALVGLGFWPGLREAMGGAPDHCETAAHHPHLCWLHTAGGLGHGPSHDMAALAVFGLMAGIACWQLFRWGQDHGRLNLLRSIASPARELALRKRLAEAELAWQGPVAVVACDQPLCFVAGAIRPRLFLSTAVLDALSKEHLEAVLAHEQAHLARRDNLWRLAGRAAALFQLPPFGHLALRRWHQAAEEACDEAAAQHVGSRLTVAEALVRFQRLRQVEDRAQALGMAFGHDGALKRRVQRLLSPPEAALPAWVALWPLALLALGVVQADGLHTALETSLGWLHF